MIDSENLSKRRISDLTVSTRNRSGAYQVGDGTFCLKKGWPCSCARRCFLLLTRQKIIRPNLLFNQMKVSYSRSVERPPIAAANHKNKRCPAYGKTDKSKL